MSRCAGSAFFREPALPSPLTGECDATTCCGRSFLPPSPSQARFQCAACQHKLELQYIDNGRITEPAHCSNCSSAGTMTLVHNASKFTNKQQLRMQENPDSIPDGETPHTVSLSLFDELVDIAKPGDRVEVTGVYRAVSMRVAPNQRTLRSIYKTYIDVIHVRKVIIRVCCCVPSLRRGKAPGRQLARCGDSAGC